MQWPGVRTQLFPVIKDYTECILNLPQRCQSDFTADVARCFEAIPTGADRADGLLAALRVLVDLVFDDYRSRFRGRSSEAAFKVVFGRHDGLPTSCDITKRMVDKSATKFFSRAQFLQLSALILKGAVTAAGGILYLQRAGIPMGLRSSPDWCNLYLLHKEITAVQRIVRFDPLPLQLQKLSAFNYFFRSMDDLRVINGQPLVDMILFSGVKSDDSSTWIYPDCLGIEITSVSSPTGRVESTCFLDIITHYSSDGEMSHTTFAKESKLPFKPIQFVDPFSNRPSKACYNVAVGVTLHAILHASSPELAAERLRYISQIMTARGYQRRRLIAVILQAINSLDFPGLPYDVMRVHQLAQLQL